MAKAPIQSEGAPEKGAEPVVVVLKKLVIAPGCSITSKIGILGPGREVTADLFVQGNDVINARRLSGHIVEVDA